MASAPFGVHQQSHAGLFEEATRFVKHLADEFLTHGEILSWGLKSGTFLNINVPDLLRSSNSRCSVSVAWDTIQWRIF